MEEDRPLVSATSDATDDPDAHETDSPRPPDTETTEREGSPMTWERYVIGTATEEEPTVPLHYPLVAVLAVLAAVVPNTWFLPSRQGYYVSGVILCAIVVYAVFLASVRPWTDSNFLLLFGAYWVGLVVPERRDPSTEPATAVDALKRSRAARAAERIRDRSDSPTDFLPRGEEG